MKVSMGDFFLPALPFYIGSYSKYPKNIPKALPFSLTTDQKTGLITEVLTGKIESALKLFYKRGGYASTPLGEGDYGKRQGEELFEWIIRSLKTEGRDITETSFLELGAGYGYLLYLLKKGGAKRVLGIEPGNEGIIGARKYNVEMIRDFFPTPKLVEKFDYVLSYGVLEHIKSPGSIFKEIKKSLTSNGIVFAAVPETERKMRVGDPSIIAHQHVNYFSEQSLINLFHDAGFGHSHVEYSPKRSMLVGWATTADKECGENSSKKVLDKKGKKENLLRVFKTNILKNIATIQEIVNRAEGKSKTLGFYAPSSNLLGLLQFKNKARIFDSDPWKHGKHIAGSPLSFEPPEALRLESVDMLFICAIDYDREITDYLMKNNLLRKGKTEMVSLKKIYENTSGMCYLSGKIEVLVDEQSDKK
jgi:SAM-dependent methyltransferase